MGPALASLLNDEDPSWGLHVNDDLDPIDRYEHDMMPSSVPNVFLGEDLLSQVEVPMQLAGLVEQTQAAPATTPPAAPAHEGEALPTPPPQAVSSGEVPNSIVSPRAMEASPATTELPNSMASPGTLMALPSAMADKAQEAHEHDVEAPAVSATVAALVANAMPEATLAMDSDKTVATNAVLPAADFNTTGTANTAAPRLPPASEAAALTAEEQEPTTLGALPSVSTSPRVEFAQAPTLDMEAMRKIKVFFLNIVGHEGRRLCMKAQLDSTQIRAAHVNINLTYSRFPAVTFSTCTTPDECVIERPDCFPTGGAGYVPFPRGGTVDDKQRGHIMRSRLGSWCSRIKLFSQAKEESSEFDYFLLLEDSVLLGPDLVPRIRDLVDNLPDYWDVVALDNYNRSGRPMPESDSFPLGNTGLRLFSISPLRNQYQGAHAWLVSAKRVDRMERIFQSLPATAVDWVGKVPRPLHRGMWSYPIGQAVPMALVSSKDLVHAPVACSKLDHEEWNDSKIVVAPDERLKIRKLLSPRPGVGVDGGLHPRELIIFGMHASGAKFLHELVEKRLSRPAGVDLCRGPVAGMYCGRVWSHTHPNRVEELSELRTCNGSLCPGLSELSEAVAVAIVRHPFSLVRSLQSRNNMRCGNGTVVVPTGIQTTGCWYEEPAENFLQASEGGMTRLVRAPCGQKDPHAGRPEVGHCWSSYGEAWNGFVAGYKRMEPFFHKLLIVRFEDVIDSPDDVLRDIAEAVELPAHHLEDPDEAIMQSSTFRRARTKVNLPDYGADFTCAELNMLCTRLNRPLLYQYGYHGCQAQWPGFEELTFHTSDYEAHPNLVNEMEDWPEERRCALRSTLP